MNTLALIIFTLFLSVSCTTKVDGLYVADEFKPSQIKSGELAVGGVISPSSPDVQQSLVFSEIMRAKFSEEREYIPLKASNFVVANYGTEHYEALLSSYSQTSLTEKDIGELASKLEGVRFVSFARIDNNNTSKLSSETVAKEYKDSKGKVKREPGKITKTHQRKVSATLHIYDLTTRKLAFTGKITKTMENSNTYEKNAFSGVVSLVNAVRGKSNEGNYPTPEAPSIQDLLGEIFEGFAENFPEPE